MLVINLDYLSYLIHRLVKFGLVVCAITFLFLQKYLVSIVLLLLLVVVVLEELIDTISYGNDSVSEKVKEEE